MLGNRIIAKSLVRPALAVAVGAALTLAGACERTESGRKKAKRLKSVNVSAAAERIRAGTVIKPDMFLKEGVAIPEAAVTGDHILVRDEALLIGFTINRTVERGTPLLASYFHRPVERVEQKLDRGERAVALQVDAATVAAGNIVPGSHVDIFLLETRAGTTTPGEKQARNVQAVGKMTLLLSNVTVISVGGRAQPVQGIQPRGAGRDRSASVTVAVTPKEAGILLYAQECGRLMFALRAPADRRTGAPPPEINRENLLRMAAEAEAERKRRQGLRQPVMVRP